MSPERDLFAGLPKPCIDNCPRLKPLVLKMLVANAVSEYMLNEGLNVDTAVAGELPPEVVEIISDLAGEGWDAESIEGKEKALQFLTGEAYKNATQDLDDQSRKIRDITNRCTGDGPLKARVNTDYGKVIVGLCRSDIATKQCTHDHTILANLRREE
jgi:hypothetical protein